MTLDFIIFNYIFSFFFNVLYYKLIKTWIELFKLYKNYCILNINFFLKIKYSFYILNIILFDILFFVKYYFKLFGNIFLLYFLSKNNNTVLYYLTIFNKYHYIFKSQIYLYFLNTYKNLIIQYNVNKNKQNFSKLFLEVYFNNKLYYNIYYIYYVFLYIYNNILIDLLLYIETYFTQILHKSNNKKKLYMLNFNYYIERLKFWKKEYYIKMKANFLFHKSKRLLSGFYYNFINKIKKIFRYFRYIIISILDPIFFYLFKNKGNFVIYYFYYILKFFKSYILYVWKSDIIYRFLKFIERKKWYLEEMHERSKKKK